MYTCININIPNLNKPIYPNNVSPNVPSSVHASSDAPSFIFRASALREAIFSRSVALLSTLTLLDLSAEDERASK
jgi:hypothetical protein